MSNEPGYQGLARPDASASDFNAQAFLIRALLSRVRTALPVQVRAVTNSGGVSPVGFVDIEPLVAQVDGLGNAVPHAVIFRCPYFRLQGGANAVIIDPEVGDIGLALVADRDISSAVAAKGPATPGSTRRFDLSDALYIGGFLNEAPTQYVQFSAAGIKLHSPTAVVLEAPDVQITAATIELTSTGATTLAAGSVAINAGGAVAITSASFTHNGVNVGATHVHGGVQAGGANTAVPH